MSTLQITLSGVSFPSTFPVAYPDSLMSSGTLILLDFAAEGGYDGGTGVPVSSTMMPNIAWQTAARIIGSGDRNTLSPFTTYIGLPTGTSSTGHFVEWTAKKALHFAITQLSGGSAPSNRSMSITNMPPGISQHVWANTPGHEFYVSVWKRTTRANGGSVPQAFHYITSDTFPATTNNLEYMAPNTMVPFATRQVYPGGDAAMNTLSVNNWSNKFTGWIGVKASTAALMNQRIFNVGPAGGWGGLNQTGAGSHALYRFYLEDLTISNRTFEEVRALDNALFSGAFASGGRFYNDSWTNPSGTLA